MEQNSDVLDSMRPEDLSSIEFEVAGNGMRILNHIIDTIGYYLLLIVIFFFYGLFAAILDASPDFQDAEDTQGILIIYLIVGISWVLYYTASELFFKGKTLGKLLTRTRAVKEDNQPLDFKAAFLRSICRLIPFEAFTFLAGNGLHDTIPKTKVIVDKGWKERVNKI